MDNREHSVDELERMMDEEESVMDEIETPELPTNEEIANLMNSAKTEAKTEAEEYVMSLAKLYLPEDFIGNEYIKEKIKQDIINLGNCIFNLNQTQNTIVAMQSDAMSGNTHPRAYEVLGQIFKTNMDVMKYKKQYMQILEREYSDFRDTYETIVNNKVIVEKGTVVPKQIDRHSQTSNIIGSVRAKSPRDLITKYKEIEENEQEN